MATKRNSKKKNQSPSVKSVSKKNKQQKSSSPPFWIIYAVMIITVLLYIKSVNFDFILSWDDDKRIIDNPLIRDFSLQGIKNIFFTFYDYNYFPFTLLTFSIEYKLFGLNPLAFHLLNVLLHALNVFLAYKMVEKISRKRLTAIIVSILLAVHPMNVETVAWITERNNLLYATFFLSSLIIYNKYIENGFKIKYYLFCFFLFLLALFSKSSSVTLPIIILAFDMYKTRKLTRKMILEKIPFFALSLLFGILTLRASHEILGADSSYSFIDKIFLLSYTIVFYLIKLIIPIHQSAMYFRPDISGGAMPWFYYASLPLLLLLGWLILKPSAFRREKLFGSSFFLITISVMLQIVSSGEAFTAERFTYIPYIGLFYMAGQWIAGIRIKSTKNIILYLGMIFIILISTLTWQRIGVWKNGNELFSDVIKKYPHNFKGYWARADYKYKTHDYKGALQDIDKSILRNPGFQISFKLRTVIRMNLGDLKGALADSKEAVRLNPADAEAYSNSANIKAMLNDFKGALTDYSAALQFNPNNNLVLFNRGLTRLNINDTSGACEDWHEAKRNGNVEAVGIIEQYCK